MKKQLSLVIISLIIGNTPCRAEMILEVIQVNNRPAAEIQPLLQPLLDANDQVIADGSNLIVKTSLERLAEIKSLINSLDSRQHNLLITVLQNSQISADELNAAARARINIPANDASKTTAAISGHVYQTQDKTTRANTQSIRTLEGNAAVIKIGNSTPVQNVQTYSSGYGYPTIATNTEFVDTSTGFSVVPRLTGDQVTLEVSPWSERMGSRGVIHSQAAQSSLRVNLGEWVELGGITENSSQSSSGRSANIRQTGTSRMHILIKVEKVN